MPLLGQLAAGAKRLPKGWRQAIRMTAAALIAHAATQLIHLNQGQWAVITCLVVVQGSFANTLDASLTRIYGTLAGALFGGLGTLVLVRMNLPATVVLGIAIAPMAAIAAIDQRFRLAPVTAGIVVLAASASGGGITVAFDRVAEILLGAVVGVACTLFILPERAEDALIRGVAGTLEALGAIARAHLVGNNVDQLHLDLEAAFVRAQAAAVEVAREQQVKVGRGPPPRPLMVALRRLRTDVALIERAVSQEGQTHGHVADAGVICRWFAEAASALRDRRSVPDPPPANDISAGHGPQSFAAFGFVIAALRRDQADFKMRVAERLGSRAG